MDLFDFLLAVFAGVISSILIVGYTFSENERKKFNQHINNLFDEIEQNRRKLPNFPTYLTDVKREWTENNNLKWIDHNEISVGYGNYLYNFFKFDAYTLFTGTGLNLSLESGLDYSLKLFYYHCKLFCATTQKIEEQLRVDQANSLNSNVDRGFEKIEGEFEKISTMFQENIIFSNDNRQNFQISWISWHIDKIRKVNGCEMESRLARLVKFLFPHGSESGGYWALSLGSIGMICLGTYLLLNGSPFSSVPATFSLMNSAGFFMMSFGLALLLFAFNRHSSIGSRKQMDEIIGILKDMRK